MNILTHEVEKGRSISRYTLSEHTMTQMFNVYLLYISVPVLTPEVCGLSLCTVFIVLGEAV